MLVPKSGGIVPAAWTSVYSHDGDPWVRNVASSAGKCATVEKMCVVVPEIALWQ
jgi:hypothetical protein